MPGTLPRDRKWNSSVPKPANKSVAETERPASTGTSTVAPNIANRCCRPSKNMRGRPSRRRIVDGIAGGGRRGLGHESPFKMEGRSSIADYLPERYDPNHCTRCAMSHTRRHLRTLPLFPNALGNTLDQRDLCPLLVLGQLVANLAAGKATLRRQIQVLERNILCSLVNTLDDGVLVLKLSGLGGHQAQHDLLARGNVPQRLKTTGARRIELQVKRVDILVCEQVWRDGCHSHPRRHR